MCGLAFAGKSTLARILAKHTGSKLIAFDNLWVEKAKEQPVSKGVDGWRFIRKIAQDEISKCLHEGISVVYDDNNVRLEHREELRKVAKEANSEPIIIYLNTPLEIIRAREQANKVTGKRHEVEPENFQTVLEQLEPPSSDEKALEFKPNMDMNEFLKKLD